MSQFIFSKMLYNHVIKDNTQYYNFDKADYMVIANKLKVIVWMIFSIDSL